MKRILAISIGCPSGIGPEVAVRAAADFNEAICLLVGDAKVIERAASVASISTSRFVSVADPSRDIDSRFEEPGLIGVYSPGPDLPLEKAPFGHPTAEGGRAQLAWIDAACDLAASGIASALVTGPVSKHAILASEASPEATRFLGHTEHLARRLGGAEVTMAFWSEELVTGLVTTHLPLRRVPEAITKEKVATAIVHITELALELGAARPRIAVASLNPHAGEEGALGDEEALRIAPGIALAREILESRTLSAEISGPVGAETAIRLAHGKQRYDAVVAMYHDQATIPMKLIGFGEAVNVTLGLPIIRTSVDHGTAYDLAGTGEAGASGMRAALDLATRLSGARLDRGSASR